MNKISCVYLNGEFLAPEQAKISAFDRGFIFGDGVYEVIPVFGGRPFRLANHLSRLERSLSALGIINPLPPEDWEAIFQRLITGNGDADQSIYLQITRGVAERDHSYPENVSPTVFAYAQIMRYPDAATIAKGVSAITLEDIRWQRCDIKAVALLANVMMRQKAVESGSAESILIRDGLLTEGAASNIFIVKDGRLQTPPRNAYILPGITRDLIVELAEANGIQCLQIELTESELMGADEVWMTSSTKEILPVTQLNHKPVGSGIPGPMHAKLYAIYQDYKEAFRQGKVR